MRLKPINNITMNLFDLIFTGTPAQRLFDCLECPGGFYCGPGTITPHECGVGFYSKPGVETCTVCQRGYELAYNLINLLILLFI